MSFTSNRTGIAPVVAGGGVRAKDMTADSPKGVVDLHSLRRSCGDCSLRTLCLPAGMARDDIDQLDAVVRARVPLASGETLFSAGDPLCNLFVVRAGTIRTSQTDSGGEDQILGFHVPGDILGLDAISEERHQCNAVALERTSLCAVPFAHLESVAQEVPGLQHQFLRIMSRELIRDHEHLAAMGRRSARERLAVFLHSLSERRFRAGYPADELHLAMSRADIANYLGLALETVSRLLTRFAEEEVIEVERRRLRIRNVDALRSAAGER